MVMTHKVKDTVMTPPNDAPLLFLKGSDIVELLKGREQEVLAVIKAAYQTHARGNTSMPPNSYLRFPGMEKERIIAKAAWLGGEFQVAGIKWIASFPGNLHKNLERASATLILNDSETGRPTAVMESSVISAYRTAASAALAARELRRNFSEDTVGIVGCGLINYETLRFLLAVFPRLNSLLIYDLSPERATQFADKALELEPDLKVQKVKDFQQLLRQAPLISLATTAVRPFIANLKEHKPGAVLLHISLRDIAATALLKADNIVDDVEQVCSNQTSLHLAEQQVGHRDFIRTTIGGIFNGQAPGHASDKDLHIFHPFGLGILDLAMAHLVQKLAREQQRGLQIDGFFPRPWLER